ncbi:hypothetical protein BDY19DRAFT_993577 [Irpex rosettiformis]|uniref:Uncharacterized protein n=1 Tax=Irpex rosettiformis TaxID=378272 RepID=A0ACB8U4R6_9APHY|nr:hypothetical protein BDY19DRAFT_993577 [Irpex rosettiformis]
MTLTPSALEYIMDSIFDGLRPRYAYDDWFYLALVPRQVRYDLPLFECLAPLACSLDRVESTGATGYRLREKLCEQWTALESITVHVQKRLLRRTAGTYLDTLAPPYPHWMGYQKIWKTRSSALLAIRLARTAFTLRFAFISFLIMKETNAGQRPWEDLSADRDDPIPLSICNSFQASWICDFNVPRIGAIVPIGSQVSTEIGSQWYEHIPGLLTARVPLWFAYGKQPMTSPLASEATRNEHRRHIPTKFSVHVLKKATERAYGFASIKNDEVQRHREDGSWEDLNEKVFYGYILQLNHSCERPTRVFVRQRNLETFTYQISITDHDVEVDMASSDTYETFVAQEKTAVSQLELAETSTELAKRLNREAINRNQPVPTPRGPAVFAWVLEGQRQVRMCVDHPDIIALWTRTTTAQRYYNPFRDEYDVLDISKEMPTHEPASLHEFDVNVQHRLYHDHHVYSAHAHHLMTEQPTRSSLVSVPLLHAQCRRSH